MGESSEAIDETRSVSKAEIEAGVKVRAGHRVTFVVDGVQGKPRPQPNPGDPEDPGAPANPDRPADPGDPANPDNPQAPPGDPSGTTPAPADPGTPDTPPAQPPTPAQPGPAPAPPMPGQIDLQIVSAAGVPQPALELELTLPDATKRAGRTGTDGHFSLDELPPAGNVELLIPDVRAPAADAPASAPGRIRYTPELPLAIGSQPVIELPPRVRRGMLSGIHFETNKTFLLPSAMAGIRQLTSIYQSFNALAMLVTGHTDTVGDAAYNRGLSVDRAESIAAFLVDDVGRWMANYQPRPHSAAWGTREDQFMLATLLHNGAPFYASTIDGQAGPATKAAFESFQEDKGLPKTGRADEATRRALIAAYMALEGTTLPKGSPPPLTHGCGLTHLAVPTGPGVDNQANRRVELFLFEGEVTPQPQTPCPSGGCAEFPQWVARAAVTVDLDQPPGSLDVSVTDAAGKPLDGVHVHASGLIAADGTTASGAVKFDPLVPGDYKVIADLAGFDAADAAVTVASGAPSQVTLQMKELPPMEIESLTVSTVAAGA